MDTFEAIKSVTLEVMQKWDVFDSKFEAVSHDIMGRMIFLGYRYENNYFWHANIQGRVFYLLKIWIPEPCRGHGIGDQLYALIVELADKLGCEEVRQTPTGWAAETGEPRADYLARRGWVIEGHEAVWNLSANRAGVKRYERYRQESGARCGGDST